MKNILSIDGHCDAVYKAYRHGFSLKQAINMHVDLERLAYLRPHIQFFALYSDKRECDSHFSEVFKLIDFFYREILAYSDIITLVKDIKSFNKSLAGDKIGAILSLEGAYLMQNNLHRLDLLYSLGVRCISLTWNNGNSLCGGIGDTFNSGLSREGKKAVLKMNQLGILIDLSHISKKGFWDIIDITDKPVVATHSNCTSLCSHPRNLDDRQLKAIASLNGVVGINYVPIFLGDHRNSISGIVDHIEHAIQIAGINCVGLGSDFDGTEDLPAGIGGIEHIEGILDELLKRNYSLNDIRKILGANFARVIDEVVINCQEVSNG